MTTKQRRWQLKQTAAGRCSACGKEKPPGGIMCRSCKDKHNERRRRKTKQHQPEEEA